VRSTATATLHRGAGTWVGSLFPDNDVVARVMLAAPDMNQMNQMTRDLKSELEKSAALLRKLRDEVRVQLHLGGLEAKEEWRRLEPRLEAVLDRTTREVSDASRAAAAEITDAVRRLRESLR